MVLLLFMHSTMKKNHSFLSIALLTLALQVAAAFVPLAPRTLVRPAVSALSSSAAAALGEVVEQQATSRIIPQQVQTNDDDVKENALLLWQETSRQLDDPPSCNMFQRLGSWGKLALQNMRQAWNNKWLQQQSSFARRPSTQFRMILGMGVTVAISLLVVVKRPLFATIRSWLQHRGFQGLAALGRTVAYIWALLVGYPRLLDKRTQEKQRQERQQMLEQRRQHLRRLAAEVARLRQELAALDKEIRTFRREMIALQVNANNAIVNDQAIQEAIGAEMALLASLRADTHAALQAVRKTWAESRSKSPPELWQEDDYIWLEPPTLP